MPDPSRQTRTPLPPSSRSDQPDLHERKIDETTPSDTPYLHHEVPPNRQQKKTEDTSQHHRFPINRNPNPLKYLPAAIEDKEQDQPEALKDLLTKLDFELRELKQDARRLRRTNLFEQYSSVQQSLKNQSPAETLDLLQFLNISVLAHRTEELENLLDSNSLAPPAETESSHEPSRPSSPAHDEEQENIPESASKKSKSQPPVTKLSEKDTLRLMNKILPYGHALTTRGKLKWLNNEIKELCKLMYQGEIDLQRYKHILAYLHNAQMKIYELVEAGVITPSESVLIDEYFEQRTELLEIYERKHSEMIDRKMTSKDIKRHP